MKVAKKSSTDSFDWQVSTRIRVQNTSNVDAFKNSSLESDF